MSKLPDRQTSVLMDEKEGSYRNVMQPDTTSDGRLLSASEDSRGEPRVRMTKSGRRRVRVVLIVVLLVILVAIITVIAILATASAQAPSSFEEVDQSKPLPISNNHMRCNDDVIISKEDTHQNWRHYDKNSRHWQQLPNVKHTGFVLISPRIKLEKGHSGVLVSMQLPGNNTKFHVMAVSTDFKRHSKPVVLRSGFEACDSVAIDDRRFFTGNETVFRIYIYYVSHFRLRDMKFTVTSLTKLPRFQNLDLDDPVRTTDPDFVEIHAGQRDHCSVEAVNGIPTCHWWNMVDGDTDDFLANDRMKCISGGVDTGRGSVWFLGLKASDTERETRALLISPIIKRETSSVLFTFWYMYKCGGTILRIHRLPATKPLTQQAIGQSTVLAEITKRPDHHKWIFQSFEIPLPENHTAYQIVIEGIVDAGKNCSFDGCSARSLRAGKAPLEPFIGLDSMTLELLNDRCNSSNGTDILNCGFQTSTAPNTTVKTTCGWISSVQENFEFLVETGRLPLVDYGDWKIETSGGTLSHGTTEQHMVGRGYVLSFDAVGKADSDGYIRSPVMTAASACSCRMSFMFLMRGFYTPRLQVNLIFGADTDDETREREPQWSLYGNQSNDWLFAFIPINLRKNAPFQFELRASQITSGIANLHFDDIEFIGCDMKKYEPPSSS